MADKLNSLIMALENTDTYDRENEYAKSETNRSL